MDKNIPAISIIIPMYNTEKYISECLDSVLAQTFTDFEVIVVDDCSTDNSCAIVESYISKFKNGGGQQLKLIRSKKNSGGAATPRNTGIRLSRGEYLMFVDSDDAITKTACAELYSIAKTFNADIVYCERFYQTEDGKLSFDAKNIVIGCSVQNLVTEPTVEPNNAGEQVLKFLTADYSGFTCQYFFKRDFILENNLEYPDMVSEDLYFAFCTRCLAKKIVRVPNIIYSYRRNKDSISYAYTSLQKQVELWINTGMKAVMEVDKFMDKLEGVSHLKAGVFEQFFLKGTKDAPEFYAKIPYVPIDNLVRAELHKHDNLRYDMLISYLFSRSCFLSIKLTDQWHQIQQLQKQLQESHT